MALKHYKGDGLPHFITFCTHRSIPILRESCFCKAVYRAIVAVTSEQRCKLIAWVVMPEHVHLVLYPAEETDIGQLIGEIKTRSSVQIHKTLLQQNGPAINRFMVNRNGTTKFALWRRRCYDRNCRDEDEMNEKIQYCHWNPVRRRIAESPDRYRWSSAYEQSVDC
jgi:putative transposase